MASPYDAYAPRSPQSNIPYAGVSTAPTHPYPPHHRAYDASAASLDSDSSSGHGDDDPDNPHKRTGIVQSKEAAGWERGRPVVANVHLRQSARTPSPTPSEAKELAKTSVFDWEAMLKWRYWIRREWLWYYVAFIICLVGVILFTVYHKQIVHWLRPAADWMHDLPFGWTIPIAVLFVISFPPLFGHEIVAILCGLVWGLGVGFGIVAAGTFLGEVGNFYAFKYCCAARGEKLERNKLSYACLARVVREGGFRIALIARLSAIPGHFTTAVFSTCGMGIWTFSIAAILSLPKQFITVYLGVALEQSEDGKSSTRDTIIKDVVLGATTIITIGAMWYIYHKMNQAKPHVIYDRRKARQAKLAMAAAPGGPYANPAVLESTTSVFNPTASDAEIPLTAAQQSFGRPSYQQWDAQGRAVDGAVYAPKPQRPTPQRNLTGEGYPMSEYRPQPQTRPPQQQRTSPLPPGAGYPYPQSYSTAGVRDPFADSAHVYRPQPQRPVQLESHSAAAPQTAAALYQRQAPPRGYCSPPPEAFSAGGRRQSPSHHRPTQSHAYAPQTARTASPPPPALRPPPASAPQTPTQGAYFRPPPGAPPPPPLPVMQSASKNPFEDEAEMPNPYEQRGRHEVEPTDATFYTARGHGEEGDESPYAMTAYESSATVAGTGEGSHGHGHGPPPPAYSVAPP
ncbi:hypothetical protein C8Q77DRAFT_1051643 [Trametes polyzona]|nr:hypothetical protein C8Q77DRAFT_1051643 [Trametes polyzona]